MGAPGPGMFDKQFPSTPNLRRSNSRMIHQVSEHSTVWKFQKFSPTVKIFRQIDL